MCTIVKEMTNESQNSAGFLHTNVISTASLISGISNFDFKVSHPDGFPNFESKLPERLMLGKRAERYFSEWINQSTEYELIAENIQLIEQKQTLGEFDFIVRRKHDSQLIHVELVYKFYLYDAVANGTEIEKWIGPNRGDRLDLKVKKLSDHQFPLLHRASAKDRLKEWGIEVSEIKQEVLFLANLFVPRNQEVEFDRVNQSAVEGMWMNLKDWEHHANSGMRFAIPEKIDWFSREMKPTDWLTKDEAFSMITSLHGQKRSPLVWSKGPDGFQSRDFVVWW